MNKIKVNLDKSRVILFSYRKKYRITSFKFGNGTLGIVDGVKFLGMEIDRNLSFRNHTDFIRNKISKVVGILFRLNNVLPLEILKIIYNSLLLPHITYGLEIWYGALQGNQDRVFKIQKKAIRAINKLPYNDHTHDFF